MKKVFGFGQGYLDIITINNQIYNYESGGTSFNVIANLLKYNFETYASGYIGSDNAGQIILNNLKDIGVNIDFIKKKKGTTTKIYSNIVIEENNYVKTIEQGTCPVCKKRLYKFNNLPEVSNLNLDIIDIAIFDSIANDRLEIARKLKEKNKIIVIDIGCIGNLRYLSKTQLINKLQLPYTIIQVNGLVIDFIKNKLELQDDEEIFKLLGCELLITTYGNKGSNIICYDTGIKKTVINFNVAKVLDTAGAGDAFLAGVIIAYKDFNNKEIFIKNVNKYSKEIVTKAISNYGGIGYLIANKNSNLCKEENTCQLCGSSKTVEVNNKRTKNLLNIAVNNIERNLILAKQSEFKEKLDDLITKIKGNVIIVGAGASFTTANVIATCLNNYNDEINAKAIRPRDLYNERLHLVNYIILCSYSGKSNDIITLIDEIRKYDIKAILITHELIENSNYDYILSYGTINSPKEKGFIAVESILIPLYFFFQYFSDENYEEHINNYIKNIKTQTYELPTLSNNITVDVIYDAESYPIAVDLESKFIESSFGRVTLHEKKDISHGRYMTFKNNKSNLQIYLNYQDTLYQQKLIKYLKKIGYNNIVFIESDNQNKMLKLYEMLIQNQIFFNYLGNHIGKDLSSPGYKDSDLVLYKHKGMIL